MDIPPHLVANNKDLLELSKARPSSSDQLLRVDGMSVVKGRRIGAQVLAGKKLHLKQCCQWDMQNT